MEMSSDRLQKLEAVAAGLQYRYGPAALSRAAPSATPIACFSTTFPALDGALRDPSAARGGGLPRGRITEIIGAATSGKLTLAAKTLATVHREPDLLAAWLDLPRTCDADYLYHCGLDLNRLLVVRPRDSGDALAIALHLVESNALAALVFDGATCLTETDAVAFAGSLERLANVVTRTQTAIIFLTDPRAAFRTLAHVATVRLELRRQCWLMRGSDVLGYESHVEILKNRLGRSGLTIPLHIVLANTAPGLEAQEFPS
jgi:recombination protein RecA